MTNLTEVAKNFSDSAKKQRRDTEQAVRSEFQRLRDVIEQESANAAQTSKSAIQSQSWKASAWQTFNVMPIVAAFLLGLGLALILMSGHQYRIVSTITNDSGVWTKCQQISLERKYCLIREAL